MENKWVEYVPESHAKVDALHQLLKIDPILCSLLLQRKVNTFEQARVFFRPDLAQLHDPFKMQDMQAAVERIQTAIERGEKILIYGDYDVDGTTAVALVYSYFKHFHASMGYYVPDREKEGYGISKIGIDWAHSQGYTLIIALDCGIKSVEEVQYAQNKNIDFIIGDHHTPDAVLPDAVAVLDPKRADCNYPFKELSGCGIGFKLIQADALVRGLSMTRIVPYLDLVAVSIASDIVPIVGENRVLAHFGLAKLNQDPCPGLSALKDMATRVVEFSIEDVIFQIGPRINAAGRIRHASDAVKLLIATSAEEAKEGCALIEQYNLKRKEVDGEITREAIQLIEADPALKARQSTVLYNKDWHKGVIGIVASRLIEAYYRPTVILTSSNGHVTGSARSVKGFDLYEALSECSDLLIQYGGHKYAAGLTMQEQHVPAFQEMFETVVARRIEPELLQRVIYIDYRITLEMLTPKFLRVLKQFAPFGPQNPAPVFHSTVLRHSASVSIVGKDHLRMQVKLSNGGTFNGIGFGLGKFYQMINDGAAFDMCYQLCERIWREERYWQLNIKDIKILAH